MLNYINGNIPFIYPKIWYQTIVQLIILFESRLIVPERVWSNSVNNNDEFGKSNCYS